MASGTAMDIAKADIEVISTNDSDSADTSTPNPDTTKRTKWIDRVAAQGPWVEVADPLSLNGAPSIPMPVEVSDKASLAPFFDHLRNDGGHLPTRYGGEAGKEPFYDTELIEFEKGVLYADGRIDLCKLVTGPRNIEDLMNALRSNTFAKHYLLGNNIIGPVGAKVIASFIEEKPDQFETWYLAGNCIDTTGFSILVDAMVKSRIITNVWMKRNPLLSGSAKDLFKLITLSPALRTLDLDQTELGDTGVAELFSLLSTHEKPIALRHIYLNAVGIGAKACSQISAFLAAPICKLESLYMSCNPIGDNISLLAPGLKATQTLQRLSLQSCGLKDLGTTTLLTSLIAHPTLRVLDIGQAYATEDLGQRFNWLTEASTPPLINLISSPQSHLQYLNISYTPTPQPSLNDLYTSILTAPSPSPLLWFHVTPLITGGKSYEAVKAGQKSARLLKDVREHLHKTVAAQFDGMGYEKFENEEKRFLLSPKDVRLIDSVYRNRDAGLARRGLKQLQKWWVEGDDTLQKVQEGSVD